MKEGVEVVARGLQHWQTQQEDREGLLEGTKDVLESRMLGILSWALREALGIRLLER